MSNFTGDAEKTTVVGGNRNEEKSSEGCLACEEANRAEKAKPAKAGQTAGGAQQKKVLAF